MRSSSCIIRCALDNMFRNSKQFSSSPSYAAASTSQVFVPSKEPTFGLEECMHDAPLLPPTTSNSRYLGQAVGYGDDPCSILRPQTVEDHDECALPKCMQFMDASDRVQHASQDAPNYAVTSCGAPRLADFEDAKRVPSMRGLATTKEIREYDFLRCIDEGSGAAPDEVDCTLHLGTASATPRFPNRNAEVLKGILDVAAASKQLISDKTSMPSFDSASRNVSLCQRDYGHLDKREIKDNAGSMPWNSGSRATIWRAESVGMSRLLRENAHDIEECENSSRTSSNSSATTIKTSAIVSDKPIMHTYSKFRDRDYSTAAAAAVAASFSSNQWFQYNDQGFAGSLPNTKPIFSMRENDRDSYLNPAAAILSAYAGPLPPHVFSGTKSSNAKEGNHVVRICAQCKTMRTPLWRNGPQGPKSLCNACGIRYKKEERRSAAVDDSKQEADQRSRFSMDPSDDQRPRLNMDDQRARSSIDPTEDQRSRFSNEDRRCRFSLGPSDDQRPRLIREELSEDRRPRFTMDTCEDQRQRINVASGDGRPRLVDDRKRPKLANRPAEN